jgi:hypothetical protein
MPQQQHASRAAAASSASQISSFQRDLMNHTHQRAFAPLGARQHRGVGIGVGGT